MKAALTAALLLAVLYGCCFHRVRIDGPLRVQADRSSFEGWLPIDPGGRPPPLLPGVISCGVDGKCRLYAVMQLPAETEAASLAGKPATLWHVEFSLPIGMRFGVMARTLQVEGRVLFRNSSWPVYGAFAAAALLPMLVWGVVAALKRRRRAT